MVASHCIHDWLLDYLNEEPNPKLREAYFRAGALRQSAWSFHHSRRSSVSRPCTPTCTTTERVATARSIAWLAAAHRSSSRSSPSPSPTLAVGATEPDLSASQGMSSSGRRLKRVSLRLHHRRRKRLRPERRSRGPSAPARRRQYSRPDRGVLRGNRSSDHLNVSID